jgi:predicted nucleotide-binding protein
MIVLLAEDDVYFGQLIADRLADHSIDVDRVGNAEDALQRFDINRYDCAILDSMLPNDPAFSGITELESQGGYKSGIAVARRFRNKRANTPIIILTADPYRTGADEWAARQGVPCICKTDPPHVLMGALERLGILSTRTTPRSFIVHGHDEDALADLKVFIESDLNWQTPLVLREQPSSGRTVIEKFEEFAAKVDLVFILLTPDDVVLSKTAKSDLRRSRQNVIFELGFFYGQMGRLSGRIFILHNGGVEIPSDIHGIVWIDISAGIPNASEHLKLELGKYLTAPVVKHA